MPLINVRVIEGVFDAPQKRRMIEDLTEAMVAIEGENMRPVTWVVVEEVASGPDRCARRGRCLRRAVRAGARSSKGSALIRAIVQFGNTLDMTTIAEGIEEPDQLRHLYESGCPFGQGYLLAKPLEADEITALLGIR